MTVSAIQTRRVNPYSPPAEHLELQGEEAVAFLDDSNGDEHIVSGRGRKHG